MYATSIAMENNELKQESQWIANMRATKESIKDRFRIAIASRRFLRQKSRRPGLVPVPGSPALRATATGLVVARVFQGNVVFARFAHSMAKQEWQKSVRWMSSLRPTSIFPSSISSRVWSLFGYSTAGASALALTQQQPAEAEALVALGPQPVPLYAPATTEELPLRKPKSKKAAYYEDKAIAYANENSLVDQVLQAVVLPTVANACHAFMHGLNITEIHGADKLEQAVSQRPEGQSLITVCNHVASMDDPLVMAALLPPSILIQAKNLRWTLCATDRCFTNAAFSAFFRSVKVLPLRRGAGLQQEGIDIALSKLKNGDWVHIFPEGSRSRDGGKTIGAIRRGIGRLVTDVEKTPVVIPFVHTGMQEMMPIGSKFPSIHKKVTVLVGDPIELDDIINQSSRQCLSKEAVYDAIAVRVGERMRVMKAELDELVLTQRSEEKATLEQRGVVISRAENLLQYIDWESQGLLLDDGLDVSETFDLTSALKSSTALDRESHSVLREKDMVDPVGMAASGLETLDIDRDEFLDFEEDDDMSMIATGSLLSRFQGFVDTPTFLGVGFAARGLLSSGNKKSLYTFRGAYV